jgi:hypothetical protein
VVNLDIPPDEPIDAEELEQLDEARHSARFPKEFHDTVLKRKIKWAELEALAIPPILDPENYKRNHPKDADGTRAEQKALAAILKPKWIGLLP